MAHSIVKSTTSILVTCPDYDRMTRYLSAWASIFIKQAQDHGHEVNILKERNTTRANFEGMVTKMRPAIIFVNGHGAADRLAGHDHKIIIDFKSAKIQKDAMVYAVSCKSAKELGVEAVVQGAKGYVGYTEDFILVSQPDKTRHPKDDTTAALFLEPSNEVVTALVKGHTAR